MQEFLEDFSRWTTEELVAVPPESLEAVDLIALVIEFQNRMKAEITGRKLIDDWYKNHGTAREK